MTGIMDGYLPQVARTRTRRETIDPTFYTNAILEHMKALENLFNQFRTEVGALNFPTMNDNPGFVHNP
eukprot:2775726-Rhodomonas_salina.1